MVLQRFGHDVGGATTYDDGRFDRFHALDELVRLRVGDVIEPRFKDGFRGGGDAEDADESKRLNVERDAVPRNQVQGFEEISRTQRFDVQLTPAVIQTQRQPPDFDFLEIRRVGARRTRARRRRFVAREDVREELQHALIELDV